jgi:hypothetical protein
MSDLDIAAAVIAASRQWFKLDPNVSGDPNTIDLLWLAYGFEEQVRFKYPKKLPPKETGIEIVESVEVFIKGLIRDLPRAELAERSIALNQRLSGSALLSYEPITNLAIAFCVWTGCIGMAKCLRVETSDHTVYTTAMRVSGYEDLVRTWEADEQKGNPWVRYGVSLARELERRRGNAVVDDWVPKSSPYWD